MVPPFFSVKKLVTQINKYRDSVYLEVTTSWLSCCADTAANMSKIAVIGAGVIGLTTAVAIQERFDSSVSVTIFTENVSPNTTGDISAGLWTPYLMKETPQEDIM